MKIKKLLIPILLIVLVVVGIIFYFLFFDQEEILNNVVEDTQEEFINDSDLPEIVLRDREFPRYENSNMVEISGYDKYFFAIYSSEDSIEEIIDYYAEKFPELEREENSLLHPLREEVERDGVFTQNYNEHGFFVSSIELFVVGESKEYLREYLDSIDDFPDDRVLILYTYYAQ